MAAPYLVCFAFVSTFYHLPANVLPSMAIVEGGRPGLAAINKTGSADLGVMQINSLWIAPLALHTRQPEGSVRRRLLHDPCFNIAAAGAILRIYLDEAKGDMMQAIGNYHSYTPGRNQAYRLKVLEAAERSRRPARGYKTPNQIQR